MIKKFTSVKEVILKIYRDHGIRDNNRWADMIEWAAECMEYIGVHDQHCETQCVLDVQNYRACLPCDFVYESGVLAMGSQVLPNQGTIKHVVFTGSNDPLEAEIGTTTLQSNTPSVTTDLKYYIDDCWLRTNYESGDTTISYVGIRTDDDGFPLIPDMIEYKAAITAYILKMLKYNDYINGKLPQHVWQTIDRDSDFKMGAARSQGFMPDIPSMEAAKNAWIRLIPNVNEGATFFNGLGNASMPSTQ